MKFRAFLLEMAESDIMKMISTADYMRIKARDPNPVFRAYVVGHEGESKGMISSFGQKIGQVVKTWYKAAIQKLHDKIDVGLKLFHGHADTNDHIGRASIGEVAGKALKTIQDRLSVIVAAYIEPQFRNLPLDIASIEADIYLTDSDGLYEADVEKVSGIALGSSKVETPGFAGATLLGQISAFAEKVHFNERNEKMSLEDVKKAIQEGKLQPSDLFDENGLFADPLIAERVKEHNRQGYENRKIEELVKERKTLQDKIDEQAKEIKTLKIETAKSKTDSLFEKMKKKRELDEKEVKFIGKKLAKFEPEDPEKIEDELNKYVDDLLDEFTEIRKDVFEEEVEGGNGDGDETKQKTEKEEKKESLTGPKKTDTGEKDVFDENPIIP